MNSRKFKSYSELTIIKNEKNYGFAEGNNIGMGYALKNFNPNYILLLNNDTVVDKDFLRELSNTGEMIKISESWGQKYVIIINQTNYGL